MEMSELQQQHSPWQPAPCAVEYTEANGNTGEHLTFYHQDLMKQQRGAFPEGDKQVVVERLHWGYSNERIATTGWDTVKPDANLCFYR
eukprot:3691447-Amphidinium_carterae.1